jgi:hypothetical protein
MKIGSRFFKDIRSLDKSAFNLTVGLRAAAFIITPIIVGFAILQPALLFASLGAVFLTFTERLIPTLPSRMLLLVCCSEAAAFGVGTVTATTGHLLSPILLGIGIFVALFACPYKVGCCRYGHGNRFCCWSGFTWFFNTISWSEDTFFSYRNVMGADWCRDSPLCYVAQNLSLYILCSLFP